MYIYLYIYICIPTHICKYTYLHIFIHIHHACEFPLKLATMGTDHRSPVMRMSRRWWKLERLGSVHLGDQGNIKGDIMGIYNMGKLMEIVTTLMVVNKGI